MPDTGTSFEGSCAWLQHGSVDRQAAQDSGQKLPFGASQFPASAQKATASGQKRPASGQLLDGAQTSKHSRQTTLDTGLKGAPAAFRRMDRSAEGQSAGSSRQTPAGSGLARLHWPISRQTPGRANAAQHARQCRADASPHKNVAQVLDLTQLDEEPATSAEMDPHTGLPHLQPSAKSGTGIVSADRRKAMLQSHIASSPRKPANVVDLT